MLIILVQRSKGGALGSSLAGGAAESTFGAEAGSVLTRATIFGCVIFFTLVFSLYLVHMYQSKDTIKIKLPENIIAPAEEKPDADKDKAPDKTTDKSPNK